MMESDYEGTQNTAHHLTLAILIQILLSLLVAEELGASTIQILTKKTFH